MITFLKHSVATIVVFLGLASIAAPAAFAGQETRNEQLAFLDAGAGLVVSLELSQLNVAHALALEFAPEERQALNLAALGAGAIFGFNPLAAKAWTASGFDVSTPMVAQIAAAESSDALLKTRIIFGVRTGSEAQRTIERMRLGDKARPHVKRDELATLFAGIPKTPGDEELRTRLKEAGVFLVARPRPLAGLLFAQRRGNFLILDIFETRGSDFQTVLRMLARRPAALDISKPGADAIALGPLGLWLRTAEFGATLQRAVAGDSGREKACRPVASLGRDGSIASVGIRAGIARRRLSVNATWHLRGASDLLTSLATLESPVLQGQGLLDAKLQLDRWDVLRDRARPQAAQSWDALWSNANACELGSRVFAIAAAWPEIAGLFLHEVSAIHPFAKAAINSLGAISAHVGAGPEPTITTEGWLRGQGADIAKGWLKTLFGSEVARPGKIQWGKGAIQPYAIDLVGGSVIGAGFRKGSRRLALAADRTQGKPSRPDAVLATAAAKPDKLASLAPALPATSWWAPWKRATANLARGVGKLELSISLER